MKLYAWAQEYFNYFMLYIHMYACVCVCQEWHAGNLQFNEYFFFPTVRYPLMFLEMRNIHYSNIMKQ